MAFPKPLRLQLGLSLSEFANLLDTNVGHLSRPNSYLHESEWPGSRNNEHSLATCRKADLWRYKLEHQLIQQSASHLCPHHNYSQSLLKSPRN